VFHVFKIDVHTIVVCRIIHRLVYLGYEKSTASVFSVIWSPKLCRQYVPFSETSEQIKYTTRCKNPKDTYHL